MNHKTMSFVKRQIRAFSASNALNNGKNHYDALGISKNATQADIKNAYYNLSKIYHPDRSQSNPNLKTINEQKFRDITEAYEVLRNVKSRRLYDKGFMDHYHPHQAKSDDPLHRFYKSRESRTRPPPPTGRTPIYNFDEWTKMHYGETLRKKQEMKERHNFHANMRKDEEYGNKQEKIMLVFIVIVMACLFFRDIHNYDKTKPGGYSNHKDAFHRIGKIEPKNVND